MKEMLCARVRIANRDIRDGSCMLKVSNRPGTGRESAARVMGQAQDRRINELSCSSSKSKTCLTYEADRYDTIS